jgi:DNA repair exonuclease SbcCD ATPase subunit
MADKIDKLELERRLEKLRADLQEKRGEVAALQDELGTATAESYADPEAKGQKGRAGKLGKELQAAQNEAQAMERAVPILERRVLAAKAEAIRERIALNSTERKEWEEKHSELHGKWLEALDAAEAAGVEVAQAQAQVRELREDSHFLADQLRELESKLNPSPPPDNSPPVIEWG